MKFMTTGFFAVNKRSDLVLHHNDCIILASESMIIIYDLEFNLKEILKGHSGTINALCIMNDLIISASSDSTIRIWGENHKIINLNDSVIALDAVQSKDEDWIVSACADGSMHIYRLYKEEIEEFGSINIPSKYFLAIKMGILSNKIPFFLAGGSDNQVSMYLLQKRKFVKVLTLSGHTDWIKSIDLMVYNGHESLSDGLIQNGDIMIASASQDHYIRLWKLSRDLFIEQNSLDTKSHVIETEDQERYYVTFHSLLTGHEDWVQSVRWHPVVNGDQPLSLVSASADKSVIIWGFDLESGSWYNKFRLGDVGGNILGYYGSFFLPGGTKILAHGYHGALQCWELVLDNWVSVIGISGHESPVQDISWSPSGAYLLSTSLDQTTRLFAEWDRNGGDKSWHEMARTQIHGYDLQVLGFINEYEYVSGADEKILRIFQANRNFVESFEGITQAENIYEKQNLPVGASLPALGLSNKALFNNDKKTKAEEMSSFAPGICRDVQYTPPLETELLQNTLWPEKEKLYGHGFEIMAVGTSPDGKYIASSCKASKAEYAGVIVWSSDSCTKIKELSGHVLTVTSIKFSPDSNWLVTAGRDRMWILYKKTDDNDDPYLFHSNNTKAHSRIIWQCSWTIDSQYFATASRDKSLKIWSPDTPENSVFEHTFNDSVTCCDFYPYDNDKREYLIAVGFESGMISMLYISKSDNGLHLQRIQDIPESLTPAKTVKAIKWRPGRTLDTLPQLAACSIDHSVRIFTIL